MEYNLIAIYFGHLVQAWSTTEICWRVHMSSCRSWHAVSNSAELFVSSNFVPMQRVTTCSGTGRPPLGARTGRQPPPSAFSSREQSQDLSGADDSEIFGQDDEVGTESFG